METERILKNHEERIKNLEESDKLREIELMKINLKLTNIEKAQTDTQILINKNNDKLLSALITTRHKETEIKFYEKKQFWIVITAIVTSVITYFFK